MLGIDYRKRLEQILSEFNSTYIDIKLSYDFLYEGVKDFSKKVGCCHNSKSITTVASQSGYDLNPDFLEILTKDENRKPIIKFYDGSSTSWISQESYSDFLINNNSDGIPTSFAIVDSSLGTRVTGTATSIGTHSGGESVLTDSTGTFLSSLFYGDSIVNTKNSYYGLVIETPTINTAVTTAMFNLSSRGGAYASWASSDTYIIQPSGRYKLYLDPPPSTSGWTVTVTYLSKPKPVYSDYGSYPFVTGYEDAIIDYAAWRYKYRESKLVFGDPFYLFYERQVREAKLVNQQAIGAKTFSVNFLK